MLKIIRDIIVDQKKLLVACSEKVGGGLLNTLNKSFRVSICPLGTHFVSTESSRCTNLVAPQSKLQQRKYQVLKNFGLYKLLKVGIGRANCWCKLGRETLCCLLHQVITRCGWWSLNSSTHSFVITQNCKCLL